MWLKTLNGGFVNLDKVRDITVEVTEYGSYKVKGDAAKCDWIFYDGKRGECVAIMSTIEAGIAGGCNLIDLEEACRGVD